MTRTQDPLLREELEELAGTMCKALNDAKRLATLRDRGLIKADRHGSNVGCSLRHPKIVDAIDLLRQVMADELSRHQVPRSRRRPGT